MEGSAASPKPPNATRRVEGEGKGAATIGRMPQTVLAACPGSEAERGTNNLDCTALQDGAVAAVVVSWWAWQMEAEKRIRSMAMWMEC
jgi:hypothetical protein